MIVQLILNISVKKYNPDQIKGVGFIFLKEHG